MRCLTPLVLTHEHARATAAAASLPLCSFVTTNPALLGPGIHGSLLLILPTRVIGPGSESILRSLGLRLTCVGIAAKSDANATIGFFDLRIERSFGANALALAQLLLTGANMLRDEGQRVAGQPAATAQPILPVCQDAAAALVYSCNRDVGTV